MTWSYHVMVLALLTILAQRTVNAEVTEVCTTPFVQVVCNAQTYEWVKILPPTPNDCGFNPECTTAQLSTIRTWLEAHCVNRSECSWQRSDFHSQTGTPRCDLIINYDCIQGAPTTPRTVNTTPEGEADWHKDFSSWQWAIIFVVIGVVVVALIILVIMLINKCCYKALHQEKQPNFLDQGTPDQSAMNSTLGSRSVSMSTLHMSTLARNTATKKKEVSQEELEDIRAQFGTAKKEKKEQKNMKHFGTGQFGTLDSRRSSGDGASGEPNGKLMGDDSSSGIGSVIYERANQGLYDPTDTCHDDYITFTMKKQAKSPLVNPQFGTAMSSKKVDKDLYKNEAPTVDIMEDGREENFRLDINSWTLNKHQQKQKQQQQQQQQQRGEPAGSQADVELGGSADIQLNPGYLNNSTGDGYWTYHDHQKLRSLSKAHRTRSFLTSSNNLAFIPEFSTLPNNRRIPESDNLKQRSNTTPRGDSKPTLSMISTSTPPSLTRQESWMMSSGDSIDESLSTSDLGLDLSLSTDQFSLKKSTASKLFYEQYNIPNSDSYRSPDSQTSDWLNDSNSQSPQHDVNNLFYSYPNISLTSQQENNMSSGMKSPVKRQLSFTSANRTTPTNNNNNNSPSQAKQRNAKQAKNSNKGLKRSLSSVSRSTCTGEEDPAPAMLFSQSLTLTHNSTNTKPWTSNGSVKEDFKGSLRFGNPRITYLTKIRLGDTIKLREDLWKRKPTKKSKFDIKGTIHYGLNSDIAQQLAE